MSGSVPSTLYDTVTYFTFLQQPHDMGTCFIHNLQRRKLRNKEVNYLPRVTWFMKLDFNSGSLASRLI